jgi:hypothetical protein
VETVYQYLEQNLSSFPCCFQDECLHHALIFTRLHKFNNK